VTAGGPYWQQLPREHRRWLIFNAVIVTAVINAIVNFVIAWLGVARQHTVPLWSWPLLRTSTVVNTVSTLFILPFVTSWLWTELIWRELRSGRLSPLPTSTIGILSGLSGGRVRRSAGIGLACLALLAPAACALLVGIHFEDIRRSEFILFQVAFTVVFGAIVTPIVALRAMTDEAECPVASTVPQGDG
jgi:hypothetical protein